MSTKHDVHALDVFAVFALEAIKACILAFVALAAFLYYFYKAFFAPGQAKPAFTATPAKPHVQPLYEMSTELQKHTLKELYAITSIHKKVAKHKLIAMYAAG